VTTESPGFLPDDVQRINRRFFNSTLTDALFTLARLRMADEILIEERFLFVLASWTA